MTKQQDAEFRDVTITEVNRESDGWSITSSDGWSFYVPDKGVEPRVGDSARFYGRGIGSTVRGLDIAGREVFYRTPEEQEQKNKLDVEAAEQKRRDDFEKARPRLDAKYASLPPVFRERIDGFRAFNPDWRWEHEAYEMSCCVDAVKIAEACKLPKTGETLRQLGIRIKDGEWSDDPIGRLQAFAAINSAANNYQYKLQEDAIPGLFDGHSGNSFGMALRLASLYLSRPELVAQEHGALCPLVGCQDYGCVPARQREAA